MFAYRKAIAIVVLLVDLALCANSKADVTFNFIPTAGMDTRAIAGFNQAAARWSSVLKNDITVNINIGFSNLGNNILGQTGTATSTFTYSSFYNSYSSHVSSQAMAIAQSNLQVGSTFNLLINGTTTNSDPHITTNSMVGMTSANAKALGLISPTETTVDASITFSSAFPFEFDPTKVAGSSNYDFVGIATHEIGHALGFRSGLDILDRNFGMYSDSDFDGAVNPLDMFRMSSRVSGGVIDWTADTQAKYLSYDDGVSNLGGFATGVSHGNGQQASHWVHSTPVIGVMDPYASQGQVLAISNTDVLAMNLIGFVVVPEPGSIWLLGVGSVLILGRGLRYRLRAGRD